jgi:DNA-binding CsgD family transcriptional regulator/tetratricopeptide (TPR) repeat protein
VDHGESALALRLASLWQFSLLRGHLLEGRQRLERVLAMPQRADIRLQSKGLRAAAYLALYGGDYEQTVRWAEESTALAREASDVANLAASLTCLGLAYVMGKSMADAETSFEEAIRLYRSTADRAGLAHALLLSNVVGDAPGHDRLEESLALYRGLRNAWGEASVSHMLGSRAWAEERYASALEVYAAGFRAAALLDHRVLMVMHLDGLTAALVGLGRLPDGARMSGAADTLLESVSAARTPSMQAQRMWAMERLEAGLSRDAFDEARAAGNVMQPPDVLENLRLLTDRLGKVSERPAGLTRREIEVLRLVAGGLTNAEVAARLTISARTVDAHLASIYGKLDIASRSAATRFALEHGIV